MYDIIIVGGGPAGLTAAIYGLRNGKSVFVIERSVFGGQIVNTPEIENYPKDIHYADMSNNTAAEKIRLLENWEY